MTHLAIGSIDALRHHEGQSQGLHIVFVAPQEHEVPVQLRVQSGQIVDITPPSEQLLEEEWR